MKKLPAAVAFFISLAGFGQQSPGDRYDLFNRQSRVLWVDADHRHLHYPVDHIMYKYRLNDYVFPGSSFEHAFYKRDIQFGTYYRLKRGIPYGATPWLRGKKFLRRMVRENFNWYYNPGWAHRLPVFNRFASEKCRKMMNAQLPPPEVFYHFIGHD